MLWSAFLRVRPSPDAQNICTVTKRGTALKLSEWKLIHVYAKNKLQLNCDNSNLQGRHKVITNEAGREDIFGIKLSYLHSTSTTDKSWKLTSIYIMLISSTLYNNIDVFKEVPDIFRGYNPFMQDSDKRSPLKLLNYWKETNIDMHVHRNFLIL